MKKEFCIGLILGMLGGALIINNVPKAQKALADGQKTVMNKIKTLCAKNGGKNASSDERSESEEDKPDGDESDGENASKSNEEVTAIKRKNVKKNS